MICQCGCNCLNLASLIVSVVFKGGAFKSVTCSKCYIRIRRDAQAAGLIVTEFEPNNRAMDIQKRLTFDKPDLTIAA